MAVVHGLRWLNEITSGIVQVCSDSELVMRQLSGTYTVRKPHLAELYHEVLILSEKFTSVTYVSVPRENQYIMQADFLCNQELDRIKMRGGAVVISFHVYVSKSARHNHHGIRDKQIRLQPG